MKKKLIFLCIATLCVLLVACVAFAACDPKHPAESGFKILLDFNSEQGDVTLSRPAEGKLYDMGETVTVTVTPKTGWMLDTFTVSGFDDAALNEGKYTFVIKAYTTITVTFKKIAFTITTTSTPSEGGTVELSPKKETYYYGDEVTVSVKPADGYELDEFVFDGEKKTLNSTFSYTFTVSKDITVAVSFKKIIVELQIFDSQNGELIPSSPQSTFEGTGEMIYRYEYGTDVTVTVTPEAGYELDNLTGEGNVTDTPTLSDNTFAFKITENTSISATFKKSHYTVNLTVTPSSNGSASITPQKDYYEYGDEVTLKVSPSSDSTNYTEFVVRVAGQAVKLDENNECSFTVTGNTEIEVTYVTKKVIEILNSLKGSVVFEGTRTKKDYYANEETIQDLKTTFDAKHNAVLTEAYDGLEPVRVWLFQGTQDDNIVQITHDMNGNVLSELFDDVEGVTFADLFNPFDILKSDLLQNAGENKWIIEDPAARYNIANAILGYADLSMEYFEMYEEDGKIIKIKFAFDRVTELDWFEDYQYIYVLDVKEHGTASIDDEYFENYQTTAAHEELKAAMESAAAATGYSVKYESDESSYTLYYCNKGVYIDEAGNERGYANRPDGYIWNYDYYAGTQKFEFGQRICDDLDLLKALFVFKDNNGEYYDLLKDMGDGHFKVRAADAYDSYGVVPVFFAQQLASGEDQIENFSYTFSFEIIIKDGKPYKANLDIEGNPVSITFGDWDSVILPVQIPEDVLNGAIDGAYCGDWASENGETVLNIDLDKLLYEGEEVENFTTISDGGYSFTYNEKDYTLVKNGETLTLTVGSTSTILYNCPWYVYIGDFYQDDADVTIKANSIKVKFKGSEEQTATDIKFELVYMVYEDGYGDYAYQFSFKLGNTDYVMQQYGDDYNRLIIAESGEASGLGLYRYMYEEIDNWDEYLGTYIGEGYTAKLESNKLTISYEGKSEEVTDLIFYRDWDYDNRIYYYQFSFKYGSKDCVLELLNDYTLLLVIDTKGDKDQFYLTDENFVPDYKEYYGAFDAYDDNAAYLGIRIEINENGIFIKTGSSSAEATTLLTFAEDMFGGNFTVKTADGTVYYISIWPSFGYGSISVGDQFYTIYPVTE